MKKLIAVVLALMLALSMLTAASAETANPVAGKKVAYIMLLPSATIFQMWANSCTDLCKALGVECDVHFCGGDFNKWQDTISACAAAERFSDRRQRDRGQNRWLAPRQWTFARRSAL